MLHWSVNQLVSRLVKISGAKNYLVCLSASYKFSGLIVVKY